MCVLFSDVTRVTIMFDKKLYVLDGISGNSLCSDLVTKLENQLGSKIPVHAKLTGNGRFFRMHDTIEEVCQVASIRAARIPLGQQSCCAQIREI